MVDTLGMVNAVSSAPSYNGRMLRQLDAVAMAGATSSRPLGGASGVRPGTSSTLVTATSTTWTCGAFAGQVDAETAAEAGPYRFSFDAAATGSMTPANASNPRIDIIYVEIDDPSEDASSVPAATRKYLAGTAAASPSAPTTPDRSMVVAQINVPKSGGGSPTVTFVAPFAVAAGGILPMDTLAHLNLITGGTGKYAEVTGDSGNNGLYRWSGSAWTIVTLEPTTYTPTVTGLTLGNGSITASYSITNGIMTAFISVTLGSTSVVTGSMTVSYPVTLSNGAYVSGTGLFRDTVNGPYYSAIVRPGSTTVCNLNVLLASGTYADSANTSATVPFTWASTDNIYLTLTAML